MRIIVGPAKRVGNSIAIFDEGLLNGNITKNGLAGVTFSVDAGGLYPKTRYRDGAKYRYAITLSAEDLTLLGQCVAGAP
ncbi:hypothetical protein ACTDI4_05475 [Mesorhizobium sp. PUT5]|uniref:hypothetical protein n=1 Tax=Mesorhizobium sp. PUT5 TaxID=3454629 RepID=UPI003FA40576